MRWRLGLAALGVAALGVPTASAGHRPEAIRLLDRAPLVVRGTYFHPRERVRVNARVEGVATRYVRAGATGTFVLTFPNVIADRCSLVRVVAIGGAGSEAHLKLLPSPLCSPG